MRLRDGVDTRARCRKLGGRGGHQVNTGRSKMGGVLRKRSQRESGCGGHYVIPLEVRKVPLLGLE